MKSQNQLSIAIPQTVLDDALEHLQQARKALEPYLQGLTAKERKGLFKMGDKTVSTVQKVDGYIMTNPEFVPRYMDVKEFQKDAVVATHLNPIANLATQLATDISDTVMLAGSEAVVSGLLYYGQVREAHSRGVPTARPIYEDLQPRFSRRPVKKDDK